MAGLSLGVRVWSLGVRVWSLGIRLHTDTLQNFETDSGDWSVGGSGWHSIGLSGVVGVGGWLGRCNGMCFPMCACAVICVCVRACSMMGRATIPTATGQVRHRRPPPLCFLPSPGPSLPCRLLANPLKKGGSARVLSSACLL